MEHKINENAGSSVLVMIDTEAKPQIPFMRSFVHKHFKMGAVSIDFNKILLYLHKKQVSGRLITSRRLRINLNNLKDKMLLNSCFLDYLIKNKELIPDKWKDQVVCFWGTIFCTAGDRLFIQTIVWQDDDWVKDIAYLDEKIKPNMVAALY